MPGLCRLSSVYYRRTLSNELFDILCSLTVRSTERCKRRSLSRAVTKQQALEQEARPKTAPQAICPVAVACGSRSFVCTEREVTRQLFLQGACYGCGLALQRVQPGAAGYVTPEKYASRLQHKHLNKLLCERCQDLSNGRMVPAVEDFSSRNLSGELAIEMF